MKYVRDQLYIGGEWKHPAGTGVIDVISPMTEHVVGRAPDGCEADIDAAVTAARTSFDAGEWSAASPADRFTVFERLVELYGERVEEMAETITDQMGSPIGFSKRVQAGGGQAMLSTFLQLARDFPWEETRQGYFQNDVIVRREPVGVVAAITPWNLPQGIAICKLAPALLAGCSVVLKPAPETPIDALILAEIFDKAGFPEGVVSIVPAGREVSEYLVRHPLVDKVSFTGSSAAGRRIGAICGEQLKRCSLELGGKSAAIILDDADLETTIRGLKSASLDNSGQGCRLLTRILASERRYAEVVDALAAMVDGLKVGDPFDPTVDIGPLVSQRQHERVQQYIALGEEEGATTVVGGVGRPAGLDKGWFVRPTVFADARNDMRIAREEIFGPVLAVIPYQDEADAVRIANDSEYGLAGSVWTEDPERGIDIARRVRTGTVGVNHFRTDPLAPFGGFKASGIGRECGREGLEAYVEVKSVVPAFA